MSIYGDHSFPVDIQQDGISITIEKQDSIYVYRRECAGDVVEKMLISKGRSIILNPIEPVNMPQELTNFLLISFNKELVIEPKAANDIYLTFPIEIGVLVTGNKIHEELDIFTLTKQKFTLYGRPRSGKVCRYWKSEVCTDVPETDPLIEGVMKLRIQNEASQWVKVTQAVFNAFDMSLFFDKDLVAMQAKMTIHSRLTAETEVFDKPLRKGMNKAEEHFKQKKISVASTKFVMEEGL